MLLSTCNRSEIYLGADADAAADACARFMSDYHGIAHDSIAPHLFVHRGADVAQHLFRVAAGLDSMVVGEPQILGQVKDAYAKATAYKVYWRADESALHLGVLRRQARAQRDRARRRRGVGQLRGDLAGEEDLRRPRPDSTC